MIQQWPLLKEQVEVFVIKLIIKSCQLIGRKWNSLATRHATSRQQKTCIPLEKLTDLQKVLNLSKYVNYNNKLHASFVQH